MATHTPGPWTLHETGAQVIAGYASIANVFGPAWERSPLARDRARAAEHHANARLITAAPDMLNALELILFAVTDDAKASGGRVDVAAIREIARGAIARAKDCK